MKYKLILLSALLMICLSLCSCESAKNQHDKLRVVCTQFSQYDWMRNIIGENDNVELKLLVSNGTDMHSYMPSAEDIITIKSADVFVYVGGESDSWVDDVLKQHDSDMTIVNMLEVLERSGVESGLIQEIEKEDETSLKYEHDEVAFKDSAKGLENDEHIWLSIKNAQILCKDFATVLSEVDSENKEIYNENCNAYINQLEELDKAYSDLFFSNDEAVVVIADRFPFVYLFRDYRINCFAAFEGCSSETEASFETIISLGEKLDDFSLKYVYIVDGSSEDLAKTVIDNSKDSSREILVLDSIQSVTQKDIDGGKTYLSVMKNNYESLKIGINK